MNICGSSVFPTLSIKYMTGNGHFYKSLDTAFNPQGHTKIPILSWKPVYHILHYINILILCSYFQLNCFYTQFSSTSGDL